VSQCPANQVIANFGQIINSLGQGGGTTTNGQVVGGTTGQVTVVKDYSSLINPRVKNTSLNITAADELDEDIPSDNETTPEKKSR
jgi:hypothetical protein